MKSFRQSSTWLLVILVLIGLIIVLWNITKVSSPKPLVTINNHTINIELARTEDERRRGLSGREFLAKDTGLLFFFPTKDYHPFWNYQMKFPIDVVWIDNNFIVDKTTLPIDNGQPITYRPRSPANYVLEVNAGLARNWTIGQSVTLTGI
jgi:uncharacterized membrane protein (UPF0127 family)